MQDKEKFLVFMSIYDIPTKKQEFLLENLTDFNIEKAVASPILRKTLSSDEVLKILKGYNAAEFENLLLNLQKSDIKILTIFSEDYPQKMIDLPDRPLILYAKGNLSLLNERRFAIVGTRHITNYGRIVTERFAKTLASNNFVIVSGLCYGVDEVAHRATLDVGGKTIAVIASGFNRIYPSTNSNLAKQIVEEGGLLISEYLPSFEAKRYTFPKRNRIVAGLSDGVLITEADFSSGTCYTKDFALEYGKDLFAVPGNVTSSVSNLPNEIIRSASGECVVCGEDILKYYGINKSQVKKTISLTIDQSTIVELLKNGEQHFDYLAEKSKIPVNLLNSCLTTLEINGLIRRLPAQMFGLI